MLSPKLQNENPKRIPTNHKNKPILSARRSVHLKSQMLNFKSTNADGARVPVEVCETPQH